MTQVRMAEFAVGDADSPIKTDGYVIKKGKIFQAGDYPDKQFSITPQEMMDAIVNFSPVEIDNEHRPSLFDHKMGKLFRVEAGENGVDLIGSIAIPRWMNEAIGDAPITVSTEWDIPTKRITKLALAKDPRVSDAALVASFNKANPELNKENKKMTLIQSIAELFRTADPTELAQLSAEGGEANPTPSSPSTGTNNPTPTPTSAPSPSETSAPTGTPAGQGGGSSTPVATPSAPSAASLSNDSEITALKAQVAQFAAERRVAQAQTFISEQMRDARLLPTQQHLAVAFTSALQQIVDDGGSSKVTFSKADGTQASMDVMAMWKEFVSTLPKHDLFVDHTINPNKAGAILFSGSESNEQTVYQQGLEYGQKWTEKNTPASDKK